MIKPTENCGFITIMQRWGDHMNKKTKKPFSQRICERLDIPVGTVGKTFFVEAVGRREVSIGGCLGLISYTDMQTVLEVCDGTVTVTGQLLEIHSFSGGRVSVSGIVSGIYYGEGETARNDG